VDANHGHEAAPVGHEAALDPAAILANEVNNFENNDNNNDE
jgi:hypothetical protein